MSERIAIVGSRRGADLEAVERFVRALYARQPDSLLISGGADGVDRTAEQTWLQLGGRVQSYRPKQLAGVVHQDWTKPAPDRHGDKSSNYARHGADARVDLRVDRPSITPSYGVEVWNLGGPEPSVGVLSEPHPSFADYRSACLYRDSLIAEKADRIVAFYRRGKSHGTATTMDFGYAYGKDLHEYEAAA